MKVISAFLVGLALAISALGWKTYSLHQRGEPQRAEVSGENVMLRPSIDELGSVPREGLAQKAPGDTSAPGATTRTTRMAAAPTPAIIDTRPMPKARSGAEIGVTPEQIDYIEARILEKIPDDIEPYFDLLIYVSRGTRGPYAQRLFVFERDGAGFKPYAQWLASTGRERDEKYWTGTPDGIFRLDHSRFYEMRLSSQWGTPMPFAMFFDLEFDHIPTGYAIHAAGIVEDADALGTRASAGCVRLHPEHAKALFDKIRKGMWGKIPVFAYDNETNSTSLTGEAKRTKDGKLVLRKGYKVLVIIENFEQGPDTSLAAHY